MGRSPRFDLTSHQTRPLCKFLIFFYILGMSEGGGRRAEGTGVGVSHFEPGCIVKKKRSRSDLAKRSGGAGASFPLSGA